MTALLIAAGVLIVALGIILSIALHEVGHLLPAKLFKVRVTQYMIGFGPTLWSTRKGETEYGVKALPLGGYVAMIGMYPEPDERRRLEGEEPDDDGAGSSPDEGPSDPYLRELGAQYGTPHPTAPFTARATSGQSTPQQSDDQHRPTQGDGTRTVTSHATGIFQQMSNEAREVAAEELRPGDEQRMFYRLAVWKKIIVMLGGPAMNGLIALLLTAGTVSLHGVNEAVPRVTEVYECVVSVQDAQAGREECTDQDPAGPAYEAGLRPGDEIVEFRGQEVQDWEQLTGMIRESAGQSSSLVYERNGERHSTTLTPIEHERPVLDSFNRPEVAEDGSIITEPVGFIGMGADSELTRKAPWEAGPMVWEQTKAVAGIVVTLPVRLYDVAVTTFTDAERDPDGPMSVVGVGRIAGEISSQETIPWESRFAVLMSLVAGVNVALMVFNLIPLLPLDGGHVAGALYESLRRRLAKLLGRPDPGPFDISKLLPLTYVVFAMLLGMGALLIYADIVNPIRLFE
ncbi:M50 family metallopeptidase [Nesterenkonia flava]|uniref:RIP metalloprotease n=1 Tax=Nesterenkonia flava TaxID=469799 RepID=A0ABU1FR46_9MICC|nr:RIP metalloprotease [Nesterenkonia flava]MDR5711119.1 RIP metalloprotease [Nesterenkonia flava]